MTAAPRPEPVPAVMPAAPPVGEPPGVKACVAYTTAGERRCIEVARISDALADPGIAFVWVGLYEPDAALLETMREEFGLHELAVEDARNAHQRPKIEAYGDSLFIALHTAQTVDGRMAFGETHAFIGPRYLLTVRHDASLSYAPARARCERDPRRLALGPSVGLYAVLDFIVDHYMPIVDEVRAELDALEREIFSEDYKRATIHRLYALKRDLTRLRLAVSPLQDILGQLMRMHPEIVGGEMKPYYRDVLDHAVRVNEALGTLGEMLTAAMSVNLALVTVGQGEVVKRLAGWAALLAAPTLITSWYGMNFRHMPELAGRFSYPIVLGATALVVAGLYLWLRRVRWL